MKLTPNHSLERRAEFYVQVFFSRIGWIVNTSVSDAGLHINVEIVENNLLTGKYFSVLLKATSQALVDVDSRHISLPEQILEYIKNRPEPVMLVYYSSKDDNALWQWFQAGEYPIKLKHAIINLHKGQTFSSFDEEDVKRFVIQYFIKSNKPLHVSIDEIDSFSRVKSIAPSMVHSKVPLTIPEKDIKTLLQKILQEPFERKDWGGEQNDIFSTRVEFNGKRTHAAFFLKGPSVRGKLTLAKCGKNGDQIQRLFQSPAVGFFIQYNGEIDERVIEECKQKVKYARTYGDADTFYTIIDGVDTARLLEAYT